MRSIILFALSCLMAPVIAVPFQSEAVAPRSTLNVVNPNITSPTADTVWVVGHQFNVTWDNSDLPPLLNITNLQGSVILGSINGDQEHLFLQTPLASGFFITDTSVEITVPNVPTGTYIIALLGDSGNQSPTFEIVNQSSQSSLSATTSSSSSATATAPSTEASTLSPSPASLTSTGLTGAIITSSSAVQSSSSQITPAPTPNSAASWFGKKFSLMAFASAMTAFAMTL